MSDAATIISTITGSTLAKAQQQAVTELIAHGWAPPKSDRLPAPTSTPALPGLSAVRVDQVLVAHTDGACKEGRRPGGTLQREPAIAKLAGEIDTVMAQRTASGGGKVTFSHVAGHCGDPLNERADQLATGAIRRLSRRIFMAFAAAV